MSPPLVTAAPRSTHPMAPSSGGATATARSPTMAVGPVTLARPSRTGETPRSRAVSLSHCWEKALAASDFAAKRPYCAATCSQEASPWSAA